MIREANIEDVEQIVDINIHTWYTAYHDFISNKYLQSRFKDKEKRINLFSHNIYNNINKCFVITNELNKIIGYITCGKSDDSNYDSEIFSFYILNNYQNKGYGKKLFNYTLNYLKKNNKNVIINCFYENPYKKFYEKECDLINTKQDIIGNENILINTYYYNLEDRKC